MAHKPARNRVAPTGAVIAAPGRGAWMGNRGHLHEGRGIRDVVRNHQGRAWITCALSYKDRRLPQWEPRHNTQLLFLDEAVALAAGHRPCAKCRRPAYNAYAEAWARAFGGTRARAPEMDARLHARRLPGPDGHRRLAPYDWPDLPDGAFVSTDEGPAVVRGGDLLVWNQATNVYDRRLTRPAVGTAQVITPPANVAVLAAGYPIQIGGPRVLDVAGL